MCLWFIIDLFVRYYFETDEMERTRRYMKKNADENKSVSNI